MMIDARGKYKNGVMKECNVEVDPDGDGDISAMFAARKKKVNSRKKGEEEEEEDSHIELLEDLVEIISQSQSQEEAADLLSNYEDKMINPTQVAKMGMTEELMKKATSKL